MNICVCDFNLQVVYADKETKQTDLSPFISFKCEALFGFKAVCAKITI